MIVSDYIIHGIGCVVGIIVVIFFMGCVNNTFQTANNIDSVDCLNITITDKFTDYSGGAFGGSTRYYITDDKDSTYLMWISGNITEIKQWRDIIIGREYSIRYSGKDATFCNSQKLLF